MTTTAPATTLSPKIIGQAEKHHTAILTRALSGTTVDEKQWITLNQALAAGAPVDRSGHAARVAAMTQWPKATVDNALAALIGSGLARGLPGDQIEITDAGRALAAKVRTESGRIVARAYGAVSPEDLATAGRVLSTITALMAEELSNA
jgi:DNA-binding MarR family transcriptional regulator